MGFAPSFSSSEKAHPLSAISIRSNASDEVSSIYGHLGSQLGTAVRRHEVTYEFAIAGLVLLLVAAAGSARWSGRLP